ncbi:hypothetical protein IEO21_08634 [Rhodonia placenta]|uniref:F-box domain-containing protein n=1 Tax=Rhodonia placenta TaxID=104341 RepID=A0A8H7NW39_9APHY|nr:hypothetical protein IEO21_08634 [Postia placenta]
MEASETSSVKEDQMHLRRKDVNMPYLLNIRNRSLPVELWMHILDDVAEEGDYDALARCARVCRFFREMCKKHLRKTLTFESDEDVERLKTDTAAKEIGGWRGPDDIKIRGGQDSRAIPHVATFASKFASRWDHIWKLKISKASWPLSLRAADAAVFRDLSRFVSILELILDDVTFPSIVTLGALVSALPHLKELSLRNVKLTESSLLFDPRTLSDFRLLPPTKNLQTITVGRVCELVSHEFEPSTWPCYTELLAFMNAVSDPCGKSPRVHPWGSVRNLRLDQNVWWKFSSSSISRLLRALPSLENIQFERADSYFANIEIEGVPAYPRMKPITIGVHYRQCDFFANTNPTSLVIHGCDRPYLGMREILSHVTSRCVSSIDLCFSLIKRSDRGELREGLSQLDTVLLLPVFDNLMHVFIYASVDPHLPVEEMTEWVCWMKSCLTSLDKRGILGIEANVRSPKTDENGKVEIIEVPPFEGGAPSEAMAAYTAWKRSSKKKGHQRSTPEPKRHAAPRKWTTEVTARGRAYGIEARGVNGT